MFSCEYCGIFKNTYFGKQQESASALHYDQEVRNDINLDLLPEVVPNWWQIFVFRWSRGWCLNYYSKTSPLQYKWRWNDLWLAPFLLVKISVVNSASGSFCWNYSTDTFYSNYAGSSVWKFLTKFFCKLPTFTYERFRSTVLVSVF